MIRVDDVVAGLRVAVIFDHYGVSASTARAQSRLTECPRCHARSHRRGSGSPIVVNSATGEWIHHGGTGGNDAICSGDILDLVAAFEGLNRRQDFRRLIEVAATIAGVTADTDDVDRDRRRAERQRTNEEHACRQLEIRTKAQGEIPDRWAALDRRSITGERYLDGRGLSAGELVAREIVRFDTRGNPCVRLFAFDTGKPINIVTRQIVGEPKVLASANCSTDGSIVGRVDEIDREGVDVAVIVEGITDSLAAVLAFPGCAIVGANGKGEMASVAKAVAQRLVASGGWLLVVPDVDHAGVTGAAAAVRTAIDVGLVLDESIKLVDVRPHKDLAAAWAAGWRWCWQ